MEVREAGGEGLIADDRETTTTSKRQQAAATASTHTHRHKRTSNKSKLTFGFGDEKRAKKKESCARSAPFNVYDVVLTQMERKKLSVDGCCRCSRRREGGAGRLGRCKVGGVKMLQKRENGKPRLQASRFSVFWDPSLILRCARRALSGAQNRRFPSLISAPKIQNSSWIIFFSPFSTSEKSSP